MNRYGPGMVNRASAEPGSGQPNRAVQAGPDRGGHIPDNEHEGATRNLLKLPEPPEVVHGTVPVPDLVVRA